MPRKTFGAIAILLALAGFICALSALPSQPVASAGLIQPSDRPPLFGTQTAIAATMTAAAQAPSSPLPEATREPPPTVTTFVPLPTGGQPRPTRTPTTAPPTATPVTIIIVVTATPGPFTPTGSPTTPPTSTFTSVPPRPTSAEPTGYAPPATAYPIAPGTTAPPGAGWLLWVIVLIPFVALALALWWLFLRRFPLYPLWGRPRRGSQRAGREYVRRRSFPF
jgi:hypothetical protein